MGRPDIRIPFEEAINEPRLLKPFFYGTPDEGYEDGLGFNQRAMLKAMYGIQPDTKTKDKWGWTEADYLAADLGFAEFDELGFIKRILPHTLPPLEEFRECWIVAGRRSGKTTSVAAVIVAYEAALGGHESYKRRGKPALCYQVAQDTRMAKSSLRAINTVLESMDFIFNGGGTKNKIIQVVADRIDLWNEMTIASMPPTVKSVRGYDNPISVLDEVGVWYQDADSANPDYEIYRAISPGQAQFPNAKIVGISSPWNRAGLLFKFHEAGTNGARLRCEACRNDGMRDSGSCDSCRKLRLPHARRLVLHTTTAASTNPHITKSWLQEELNKDPRAFERECLAKFQDSISGFLSSVLIEKSRDVGKTFRPPDPKNFYVGAIDPAFKRDAFGFTIVHADPTLGIVQDYVQRWHDPYGMPLDPGVVMPHISAKLQEYGMRSVYSDQYTIETLQYIANQHGFGIEEVTFSSGSKAEIYANLQQVLNQGRLLLLDDQETINELKTIEKKNTQGGQVRISAPEGQYDDMATVLAIAVHEAIWMLPSKPVAQSRPLTMIEKHIEQIAKNTRLKQLQSQDDW